MSQNRNSFRAGWPLGHLWRVALVGAVALLTAVGARAADKQFSIGAGDAAETLPRFVEQSGEQVVYPPRDVRGVQTKAVSGTMAPRAALERMLAGTTLEVMFDAGTGALAVRKVPAASTASAMQPEPARPSEPTSTGERALALEKYEVLGTRIGGPVNQTIFNTTETGVYNYDVINRVDIERMGVTSMEEMLRFIPQTSDYGSVALQGQVANPQSPGGLTFQNSEVKLRGFSSLQTSILINGRRLQRGNLSAGADLSRIPVAAIERIEILPSSASAIYGGGAIGGVINIILRKDFAGRDVTTYFGTSTDGGAEEFRLTYFEGRTFNGGRTHLSLTANYQKREPLYLEDRDYLQRALDRFPPSSALLVSGRPIYEQYIIPAFASAPGTIVLNAVSGGLGIPGNPTARFAAIPAGLTAAQASALTPADFTTGANNANLGTRFGRSILYRPEERYSLDAAFDHEFVPDKLELYAELGLNYMRSEYSYPQITPTITLGATDPLNPFRTGVTPGFVGVPVSIVIDPLDLPDPSIFQDRQGLRGVLGFKGKIGDRWEWSLDGTGEYGRSHSEGRNPTQNLVTFINSTAVVGLTQAQRRALYNPLADHSQNPATADMAPYYDYMRDFIFRSDLAQVNFRVVGDVFDLPAGPLRVSPGAELIWAQFETFQQVITSPGYLTALGGTQGLPSTTVNSRRTTAMFVETVAPLIGDRWRPLPLHAVDLNLAARWEGTDDSTDKTSPTVGLRVAVTPDVAFRVSYSEGFFPPDQSQYENPVTNPAAVTPGTDPFRGNTNIPPRIEISGGNPNLLPETSKAWNYGVILTPRGLPGLTASVDYWEIEKKNAIRSINGPSFAVADPLSYPGRVIRADPTPTDIANGWLGAVTSIDWRPVNVGFTATEGADIRLRYLHDAGGLGKFTFTTTATWTKSFREQILPVNPVIERLDSSGNPLEWRGYASTFWERDRWTVGLTARYLNSYTADSTTPTPAIPTATGFDGARIPSATTYDLQIGYRIPPGSGQRGLASWLNGTEWTFGCENILNKEPAYRTDRFGFYSRYENPRQRFVSLQIKKSL